MAKVIFNTFQEASVFAKNLATTSMSASVFAETIMVVG